MWTRVPGTRALAGEEGKAGVNGEEEEKKDCRIYSREYG